MCLKAKHIISGIHQGLSTKMKALQKKEADITAFYALKVDQGQKMSSVSGRLGFRCELDAKLLSLMKIKVLSCSPHETTILIGSDMRFFFPSPNFSQSASCFNKSTFHLVSEIMAEKHCSSTEHKETRT